MQMTVMKSREEVKGLGWQHMNADNETYDRFTRNTESNYNNMAMHSLSLSSLWGFLRLTQISPAECFTVWKASRKTTFFCSNL